MFNFTPLLGAQSDSRAYQSLLEFEGGVKILIGVGWATTDYGDPASHHGFDVRQLQELEKHIPTLSLVLLTHPTTAHLGAYAHACKHFPLFRQIPVYATTPVIALGQTLLQDMYASTPAAAGVIPDRAFGEARQAISGDANEDTETADSQGAEILYQAPTADEMRGYFALINDLKYSQPHEPLPSPFSPPLNGLTITAYSAGHTPGGTIWHITHGIESVVYAVDWNHTEENILSRAAWLGPGGVGGAEVIEQLRKPTALICSSKGVETLPLSRAKRDEKLLDMLRKTVDRGGTVLIPTDSSARVLEIAYLIEKALAAEATGGKLRKSKVYLAGRSMSSALHYARSMLEWMNDAVVREFESRDSKGRDGQSTNKSPFDFRYVKVVESKRRLDKILGHRGPKVILASDEGIDWGYSKDILEAIAADKDSCVILTDEYASRRHKDSTSEGPGQILWQWYTNREDGVAVEKGPSGDTYEQAFCDNRDLVLEYAKSRALEGNELMTYQNFLATQRQMQDTMQGSGATGLETSADVVDEASSDSSSSSDESDQRQGKALNFSSVLNQSNKAKAAGIKEVQGVNALLKEPGCYDWDVRGKKGRDAMFPFPQRRRRVDDFGEIIRPEDYLRADERDELDGHDLSEDKNKDQGLGQKRKWDDAILASGIPKSGAGAASKRRRTKAQGAEKGAASDSGYHTGDADVESEDSESDSDAEDADSGPSLPSKLIRTKKTIKANLRVGFVDFAGIHDQRSLEMLLPLIQPRKLVLIGGSSTETTWLANQMARKMSLQLPDVEGIENADILLPLDGDTVVASMDTHAWTVRLSRALTRRLRWQTVRGLGVVTVTGRLETGKIAASDEQSTEAQEATKRNKQQKPEQAPEMTHQNDGMEQVLAAKDHSTMATASPEVTSDTVSPILDVVPANMAATTRTIARPLHVGDLRLADLRKLLSASGHRAEFGGEGTLIVDGIVAVRKAMGGRIEIEGSDGRGSFAGGPQRGLVGGGSFWQVKKKIYEGLAVIAGG